MEARMNKCGKLKYRCLNNKDCHYYTCVPPCVAAGIRASKSEEAAKLAAGVDPQLKAEIAATTNEIDILYHTNRQNEPAIRRCLDKLRQLADRAKKGKNGNL
jgi:hypothetical protein